MTNSFLAFIGVAIRVVVTPGLDTALTIRSAVIRMAFIL
jgi:threonine/homoserine/homoserine lactone efflux protein